jgi:hypothetical protein
VNTEILQGHKILIILKDLSISSWLYMLGLHFKIISETDDLPYFTNVLSISSGNFLCYNSTGYYANYLITVFLKKYILGLV